MTAEGPPAGATELGRRSWHTGQMARRPAGMSFSLHKHRDRGCNRRLRTAWSPGDQTTQDGQGCVCVSGSSAEGRPFVDTGGWPLAVCTVPSHHDASAMVWEAPTQDWGAMGAGGGMGATCCFRKELADPPLLFSPS